jgi:NAD(P)H-hydrate epimerase
MGGQTITILSARDLKKNDTALAHSCLVVDAIFGTGLSSPVKGFYADVIASINGLKRPVVVAMDIPSGIDATTGAVLGSAVKADVTATMAMNKLGLCQYPGKEYAGRVEVVDIGVPRSMTEDESIRWNLVTDDIVRRALPPRRADAHKGACGHTLVIAGSPGKTGAAYMAAIGAMRAGAGLATIALPESLNTVMETKTTEVMTAPLPETAGGGLGEISYPVIKGLMDSMSAVVFGPGIGATVDVLRLLENLIRDSRIPMVIDADGLNCLSGRVGVLRRPRWCLPRTRGRCPACLVSQQPTCRPIGPVQPRPFRKRRALPSCSRARPPS